MEKRTVFREERNFPLSLLLEIARMKAGEGRRRLERPGRGRLLIKATKLISPLAPEKREKGVKESFHLASPSASESILRSFPLGNSHPINVRPAAAARFSSSSAAVVVGSAHKGGARISAN